MRSDPSLFNRLAVFTLDDPNASLTFSDRLTRENGRSRAFAIGAIDEYRKFVYLAAISPTPVTASDIDRGGNARCSEGDSGGSGCSGGGCSSS